MAIRSVKTGLFSRSMLVGNTFFDPAATWLIQRVAGTGSSGTITFSNIPSTYQHLQLRFMARSSESAYSRNAVIRFNSDSGTNYAYHVLFGTGSSASTTSDAPSTTQLSYYQAMTASLAPSNVMGVAIVDIHDYASTAKNKTVRGMLGQDQNASSQGVIDLVSGLWLSTNAITSITISASSGNFTTSSTFALYGYKGA